MNLRTYEKLIVWQEAHALFLTVFAATRTFPRQEAYGLTSQMTRAASSVPLNIVEGNMKRSMKERHRYLEIAKGSLEELHYCCRLSRDLQYIDQKTFTKLDDLIQRTSYLLYKFRLSLPAK